MNLTALPEFQAAGAFSSNGASSADLPVPDGSPRCLDVRADSIPGELRDFRYGVFRGELRPDGKLSKAPRHPSTGRLVPANDPSAWGTFDEAVAAYKSGGCDGLGVLMEGHRGVVGIDLDNTDVLNQVEPRLTPLLERAKGLGVYCERSPSGKGLRLFVKGALPGRKGRRKGGIELYSDQRFLTVTGHVEWPGSLIEGQWLVDGLLDLIGGSPATASPAMEPLEAPDLAEVGALSGWAAEKHSRLWAGKWHDEGDDLSGGLGYPSQSEADFAFAHALAREAVRLGVSPDRLQSTVAAVFRRSGLFRPEKWRQVERYAIPKATASAVADTNAVPGKAEDSVPLRGALLQDVPGDILAGKAFAACNRRSLLHVPQVGKWLRWDELRWTWCETGEEMQAAKKVAELMLARAAKLYTQDPERHKRTMAFAMRLQNLPRLEAMIALGRSEPEMAVGHISLLDSDPWLLGARNGVVDLHTGMLLKSDPAMRITRQVNAAYRRDAKCPQWLEFLRQIHQDDVETIEFRQRAYGYSLTGTVSEEVMFIDFGSGANGKSVLANVVAEILGDYGQMAPPSLLTVRPEGDAAPRNDIARLCGTRLAQINELAQGDRLNEQVVKMLAGRERLSARFLHREYFDFTPTAKCWLRTNHRPIVKGDDEGIWRRIMLTPFARRFTEDERDPWLEDKLLEERDGILAWMVEGCLEWQRRGLAPSPLVRRESAAYRKESDLLGQFIEDECLPDLNARVAQKTLYFHWGRWADANGVRQGSKAAFTRRLDERGYIEMKSNGERFYSGLKVRSGVDGTRGA